MYLSSSYRITNRGAGVILDTGLHAYWYYAVHSTMCHAVLGRSVSPATVISTSSVLEDPIANESNNSASTTPTSDTTASVTDPGDSQSHYHKSSQMENTESSLNPT